MTHSVLHSVINHLLIFVLVCDTAAEFGISYSKCQMILTEVTAMRNALANCALFMALHNFTSTHHKGILAQSIFPPTVFFKYHTN